MPYLGEENKEDLELGDIDFGSGSFDDDLMPSSREVCFICQYPKKEHDPARQGSFNMAVLNSNEKSELIRTDSERLLLAAAGTENTL